MPWSVATRLQGLAVDTVRLAQMVVSIMMLNGGLGAVRAVGGCCASNQRRQQIFSICNLSESTDEQFAGLNSEGDGGC